MTCGNVSKCSPCDATDRVSHADSNVPKASFTLTSFPWQVLFAGVNELTSFLWQVFTVASNTITQQTRNKKQPWGANFVFSSWLTLIWREKKVAGLRSWLCFTYAIWALEETYESEMVGSPLGNAKRKSVSRFCKQFSARTKRRRWRKFSQHFPFTTIRYSKHHNNKTAVRSQFPYFLWQVFLVDPYRRAILQCDIFSLPRALVQKLSCYLLNKCTCQGKNWPNSSLHTSK